MIDIKKIKDSKSTEELLKFSFVNIDKPVGPTSFGVSNFVKKALGLSKTSHLGTLDPAVSGVLPVALGRACKLSSYFMQRDKEYVGIMRLHENINSEVLKKEMKKFVGAITQLPPVRSSVKRAERVREIKKFEILEIDGKEVLFRADVEAGTYIRKLIHDLGEKIGGAHMLELRRIKAGIFDEGRIYTMYDFEKAVSEYKSGNDSMLREMLVPAEIVSKIIPVVEILEKYLDKCLTGSPLFNSFVGEKLKMEKGEKIAAFISDRFVGIYKVVNEGDILAVPEFVFN